ncbi:hypothetical protein BCR33DRAFT_716258 [Rhizoclosmatium globosum]|uniref:Uncharacterized protein n=1 Tax=Rhizoclosmatium globosum TaxID=329046 RepID=A0A1Y2CFA2_9FUNG|nr:hypothetical protein BCR33DRAFT_716258 [Rhizoclosmatium globosum]|eukprot:ORY45606.1 hypothetical protein BCR33DRAFT_716258 [Rhizoclosmatium globosum]
MDHPSLFPSSHFIDLVLSPAGIWDVSVGLVHMKMAAQRAVENGFGILRCDSKEGVSGYIDPTGRVQTQFRGSEMAESFALTVGFPKEKKKGGVGYGYWIVLFLVACWTAFGVWESDPEVKELVGAWKNRVLRFVRNFEDDDQVLRTSCI